MFFRALRGVRAFVVAIGTVFGIPACSVAADGDGGASARSAISQGADSPTELGYEMQQAEQNATLYLTHTDGLATILCSATLVAERVVVSASHCMVTNPLEWFNGDAEPNLVAPELISLLVMDGADKVCTLPVEQFSMHPNTNLVLEHYIIENDIAVMILETSAVASCPEVLPIPLAPDAAMALAPGDRVLSSGYGADDFALAPRQWASIQLEDVGNINLVAKNVGDGFLVNGDSGGGNFVRQASGSFGMVGVSSTVSGDYASLTNVGRMMSFINEVVPPQLLQCPATAAFCRGATRVECRDGAYTTVDCASTGQTCVVDSADARCASAAPPDAGNSPDAGPAAPAPHPGSRGPGSGGCSVASSPAGEALTPLLLFLFALWQAAAGRQRTRGRCA